MSIVPDTRSEKITFYQNHLTPWGNNAVDIGLDAQQVGDLATLVIAATNSLMAAEAARQASKTATQTYYDDVRAMHSGAGAGSAMISTILSFAQTTGDPNVYTLAEIPPPQPASATPPPGVPFDFRVGLLPIGALELKWKANNPSGTQGTVYEIQRSTNGGGGGSNFETVGITGVRSFIDDTIASGSSPVMYRITGIRSTKRGVTNTLTVQFGVTGASIVSSVTDQGEGPESIKLAA